MRLPIFHTLFIKELPKKSMELNKRTKNPCLNSFSSGAHTNYYVYRIILHKYVNCLYKSKGHLLDSSHDHQMDSINSAFVFMLKSHIYYHNVLWLVWSAFTPHKYHQANQTGKHTKVCLKSPLKAEVGLLCEINEGT